MGGISEESIRRRAYQIWEREGCPQGRDFEHWVQAQVELTTEGAGNSGTKKRSAAKAGASAPKAAAAPKVPAAAKPERSAAPRAPRTRKV